MYFYGQKFQKCYLCQHCIPNQSFKNKQTLGQFFEPLYVVVVLFHSNSFSYCHWIVRPQICPPSTPASLVDNSATHWEPKCNSFCNMFRSKREHCPLVFEVGEHHTMGTSSAAGRRGSHVCIGTVHPGWGPSRCYVCPGMYVLWGICFQIDLEIPFSITYLSTAMHTFAMLLWIGRRSPSMASSNMSSGQVASCTWTGCRGWLLACQDNLLACLYPYMQSWQEKLTRNANLFEDGSIGGGRFGSTRVLGGEGTKWGVYSHYWSHRRVAGHDVCTRWLSSWFTRLWDLRHIHFSSPHVFYIYIYFTYIWSWCMTTPLSLANVRWFFYIFVEYQI